MTAALRHIAVHLLPSWVLVLIAAQACSPFWPEVGLFSLTSILATLWLFLGLHRLLKVDVTPQNNTQPIRLSSRLGWLLLVAVLVVAFAHATGPRHDYRAYLRQWQIVRSGLDPWLNTNNAYGPLHNLWAWPARIDPLLPKAIFSLLLVAVGAASAFAPLGVRDGTSATQRVGLFASFILAPFALITVGLYGNNDVLPAAAMTLALIGVVSSGHRVPHALSGVILAIGTLFKFYPLIVLPAIAIQRRRLDLALVAGFLGMTSLLLLISCRIWGNSILIPLSFAGSRHSKHLSFFNFLRSVIGLDLDWLSTSLMVVIFVVVIGFLLVRRVDPLLGAILSMAAVLSVYKVGNQQFFLFFFLIAPFAIRYSISASSLMTARLTGALFAWLGFLNWYQLEYALTCGLWEGPAKPLRHFGGLAYALFSAVLLATLLARLNADDLRLPGSTGAVPLVGGPVDRGTEES